MKNLTVLLVTNFLFTIYSFSQISTVGLIAYYPFTGNANDVSGNNHNGTVIGATLANDRFGNPNCAYLFNGNSDSIILRLSQNNITAYSISAWFKTGAGGPILNGRTSASNVGLTLDVNKLPYSGINVGKVTYRADGPGIAIGQWTNNTYLDSNWHHVVGVFSGAPGPINDFQFLVYIDGLLTSSVGNPGSAAANAPVNSNDSVVIGAHSSWSPLAVFDGVLDDLRIYDRALDSTDVTALYNENICYQTITVTDTLIINANLTGFNPITYSNSVKIYPNPSNDHIIIDNGSNYNTLMGYSIRIDNSLSQIVFSTSINQQMYTIDLNTWTGNGVYFIYFIDNLGHIRDVRKIVIQ